MKNPDDKNLRRALPYFVEFVKFSAGFSLLIVLALVFIHAVGVEQY